MTAPPERSATVIRLYDTVSDERLVAGVLAGRPGAGEALFESYGGYVRRVLVRALGLDAEIGDLVQDVFVVALESLHKLENPAALKGWLAQIAVFHARRYIRQRKQWRILRFFAPKDMPSGRVSSPDFEASEALSATYRVLGKLSADEQIAFTLRFLEGMGLAEVAAACRVSLATTKRRLVRAEARFQELAREEPSLADWIRRSAMTDARHRLTALGRMLAEEQDRRLASEPLPRAPSAVRAPARRTARLAMGLGVAAALCAGLALVVLRMQPLEVSVGGVRKAPASWISAPDESAVPIQFSDGTQVSLAPKGNVRIVDVDRRGAHLLLESGVADVSVTPNRGGHWLFGAGPFTVEVKGTRFHLDWRPREEVMTLALIEGKVIVSGCGMDEARALFAGDTLTASCRQKEFNISRAAPQAGGALPPPSESLPPSTDRAAAPSAPEAAVAPAVPAQASRNAGPESWQSLARAGKLKDAFAAVSDRFDSELARDNVDDLLLLADVARLTDHSAAALRVYERIRSRVPASDPAASAAFSMGRIYFDQRDAYRDAARWFETYLNERGDGPLAREALGRQMEALSKAGDRASAARAADRYLRRYPQGPHARLARTLQPEAH